MLGGDLVGVEVGVGQPHLDRLEHPLQDRRAAARRAAELLGGGTVEEGGGDHLGQGQFDRADLVVGDI
ncbi:hypothetical protein NRB_40740 [Novosphingobium sp. 11B]